MLYDIIESVAAIGSTKEKQAIIERNKANDVLKLAFLYAESKRINFWIRANTKDLLTESSSGKLDVSLATFEALDTIVNREVTGNAARERLQEILKPLNDGARDIVCRIVNKDLRCNAGTAIANKVWSGLIPEYPVMLCGKYDEKAQKRLSVHENQTGFIVQKKSDGGRVNITVDSDGNVTYMSRNGGTLNLFGVLDNEFSRFPNKVFDGELVIRTKSGQPDRKMSNGFYTKAVRGTLSIEEAKLFCVDLWDIIPLEEFVLGKGTEGYKTRLKNLQAIKFGKSVEIVESEECATLEACFKFYAKMRAQKEEGAIIKVANAPWEDGRSKNAVKLKAVETADLLCIGTEEGNGKNVGKIGNLICTTSCGKLVVNPGSGLNDEDRARDPSYYVGKIIEVEYNEVIKSKGKETFSLFLPIYKQVRFDKSAANSLEELK